MPTETVQEPPLFHLGCNRYTEWKFDSKLIREKLKRVKRVLTKIQAAGVSFDGVAVMGTSGTWLGPLLVLAGYRVVMIRKTVEGSHGTPIEASHGVYSKLVFIDDFVATGGTIRAARDRIREGSGLGEFCFEGVVLYDQDHENSCRIDGQQLYGYNY